MRKIPHPDNPFAESSELMTVWELGFQKAVGDFDIYYAESAQWSVKFRQQVRNALYSYYPSNPCTTDEELIIAIEELVKIGLKYKKSKNC